MTTRDGTLPAPVRQLTEGKAFFAAMGLDVSHFGAIWHIFKVGQLMATDLNQISGRHGLSIADFHLLGALMMSAPVPRRATDLAVALNVSNAALSGRVGKLARQALLTCSQSPADKRTKMLGLTAEGAEKVKLVGEDLESHGRFIHHYRQLPKADREALERISRQLHMLLDRDFLPVSRGEG